MRRLRPCSSLSQFHFSFSKEGEIGSTKMLRRSCLRFHNLLSAEPHPFRTPAAAISQNFRQFTGEAGKEINVESEESEEAIQGKLKQFLKKYAGLSDKQIEEFRARAAENSDGRAAENSDGIEHEIRYDDFEPEIRFFEDPVLDREPPPEPDEQTKRDVAELVETLGELVDQMTDQKKPAS